MIAFVNSHQSSSTGGWQDGFLVMLPRIDRYARRAFCNLRGEAKDDAVDEVIASCLCAYYRLFRRNESQRASSGAFMGTFASNAQLPIGLSFGPAGDLYVASRDALAVLRFDGQTGASKGVFATTNAPLPSSSGLTVNWWPWDLAFRPDGNLYLSSFERQLVLQFDATTGQYKGIFANGRSSRALTRAAGLTFGPDNNLYLGGYFGDVVRFDGTTGALLGVFANLSDDATDMEFGPGGDLYVALRNRGAIVRVNGTTGNVLGDFTSGGQWTSSHFLLFTHSVPEPCIMLMLIIGLFCWGFVGRSFRQFSRL